MNRTIKFRGLRVDGKGWVYGDLKTNKHLSFISNFDNGVNRDVFEVNPETVGQFTGLLDKNGKEIYEGDVIDCGLHHGKKDVVFVNGSYKVKGGMGQLVGFGSWAKTTIVIGNIHEQ